MRIANPIYDSVFKYLLEDSALAKLLLATIIDEEITELHFLPQEHLVSGVGPRSLTVYRFDFAATIKNIKGEVRKVLIEIQKAKLETDIMRFRRYLGSQYSDLKNIQTVSIYNQHGKKIRHHKQALPLLTIYILGYSLETTRAPVIHVKRECYDLSTATQLTTKEPFIESLSHDSYVIQIPNLPHQQRTQIEKMLQIFDQKNIYIDIHGNRDRRQLNINEKNIPHIYLPILRRLQRAIADDKLLQSMDIEDEILDELQEIEREADYERTEKERERAEKEYERTEKERERAEKEYERMEKERERTEKEYERMEKEKAEELVTLERAEKEKAEKLVAQERAEKEHLLNLLKQMGVSPSSSLEKI